jgi:hypothetical protein
MKGRQWICLRDPLGLAEQPLFLHSTPLFVVSRLDGTNSLRDIQADYMRATGDILPMQEILDLVRQLDDCLYLDSTRFLNRQEELVLEFRRSPTRPARHAGAAYEADETALRAQISGFFSDPEGPAAAPSSSGAALRGLVSPHIDFHRGGPTYAHAYAALSGGAAGRFVIFGTCHTPMQMRFGLTRKNFETPFGPLETDQAFLDSLTRKLGDAYFTDEFSHRGEHSIEFQAVYLQYLFAGRTGIRIVPILVGSFHDIFAGRELQGDDPQIRGMVEAVKSTSAELPGTTCIIAGADLAHVGRRFGDPDGPTEASLRDVEREDRALLDRVAAGDAQGVLQSIAADNDRRHVCGYPPIYMMLRCLYGARGTLLQYRQWADFQSGAAVTFAAMAMY